MKLIIDVGNTKIKYAVYENSKKVFFQHCDTHTIEYAKIIDDISKKYKIEKTFIGSVVPSLNKKLKISIKKNLGISPIIFTPKDFLTEFNLSVFPLKEVGIDILSFSLYLKKEFINAVGICFGTAIFSVIVNQGEIKGVMIAPSFDFGFNQLHKITEKINKITIKNIQPNFGVNTRSAIESGYYHLYNGLIDSIGEYCSKNYQIKNLIITGGKSKNIANIQKNSSKIKSIFVDNCVLVGLEYLSRNF